MLVGRTETVAISTAVYFSRYATYILPPLLYRASESSVCDDFNNLVEINDQISRGAAVDPQFTDRDGVQIVQSEPASDSKFSFCVSRECRRSLQPLHEWNRQRPIASLDETR